MTLKDLIKDKDYDRIILRLKLPDKFGGDEAFAGEGKSVNGIFESKDVPEWDLDEPMLRFEEDGKYVTAVYQTKIGKEL